MKKSFNLMLLMLLSLLVYCSKNHNPLDSNESIQIEKDNKDFESFKLNYNYIFEEDKIILVNYETYSAIANKVILSNPNANEDEIRDLILKELFQLKKDVDNGLIPISKITSYYPYNLTREEFLLCLWQPVKAIKTNNLSKKAEEETIKQWPNISLHNTKADAFRHAYWNILLVKHIDALWAIMITTAHESESSGIEKSMDLHNNKIGRDIYKKYKGKTDSYLSKKTKAYKYKYVTKESEMNTSDLVYVQK